MFKLLLISFLFSANIFAATNYQTFQTVLLTADVSQKISSGTVIAKSFTVQNPFGSGAIVWIGSSTVTASGPNVGIGITQGTAFTITAPSFIGTDRDFDSNNIFLVSNLSSVAVNVGAVVSD